jgi:CHAT domain-containing protein
VPLQLLERERSVREQLAARESLLVRRLNRPHTATQVAATKGEIESLLLQLRDVESAIRAASPRYAALIHPQPPDVESIQKELGPDTLLLEYSLGEAASYLWVVSSNGVSAFKLPARAEIESAARRLYELLTTRGKQTPPGQTRTQRLAQLAKADAQLELAALDLSRMILRPAAAQLKGKRLLIVADGALQYIPFAALPTPQVADGGAARPGKPLVVEHEIVSLPAASIIAALRCESGGRNPAAKTLAVIADPVFSEDDERVQPRSASRGRRGALTGAREIVHNLPKAGATPLVIQPPSVQLRIKRLPGTRQEAERISALVPPTERLQAFDFQANLAMVLGADLGLYRYVHFATHGYLDTVRPELSAIVLSLNQSLQGWDISKKAEPRIHTKQHEKNQSFGCLVSC